MKKQDAGMNLRSHSLDKLRQIITTGALDKLRQIITTGAPTSTRTRISRQWQKA
jgi:hypothetical protein